MHPAYEWDEEIGGKGTILVDPIDGLYKVWGFFSHLSCLMMLLHETTASKQSKCGTWKQPKR